MSITKVNVHHTSYWILNVEMFFFLNSGIHRRSSRRDGGQCLQVSEGGMLQKLPKGESPADAHQTLSSRVLEVSRINAERGRLGLRENDRRIYN